MKVITLLLSLLLLTGSVATAQTPQVTTTLDKGHYSSGDKALLTVKVYNPAAPSTKATPLLCTATMTYTYADLGAQSSTATAVINVGTDKDNKMHNVVISLSVPWQLTPITANVPDIEGGDTATQVLTVPIP